MRTKSTPVPRLNTVQWQLYTSKPGVSKATAALNSALTKTCRTIERMVKGGGTIEAATVDATKLYLKPAMAQFREFGAQDTEPRGVAAYVVLDFLTSRYGIKRPDYALGAEIEGTL